MSFAVNLQMVLLNHILSSVFDALPLTQTPPPPAVSVVFILRVLLPDLCHLFKYFVVSS